MRAVFDKEAIDIVIMGAGQRDILIFIGVPAAAVSNSADGGA